MSAIRIGIVGAGDNTRTRHIPGLQAIGDVTLGSVCNRSRESSQRVADDFGIPLVYDSWEALVAADDTDAIVIGTWPNMHCPVTLAALDAGKHVMCEARMAMNLDEARAMHEAAKRRPECIAQVVPAPMSLHIDRTVQRLIKDGFLGELLHVELRAVSSGFPDADAPLSWRVDRELSGMNIMSMGIWYEILMRWVGEAIRVAAMGKVFVKQRRDGEGRMRDVLVPEHVDVIADMADGAQALYSVSSIGGRAPANEIVLRGSDGTLRFVDGTLYGGRSTDAEMEEIKPAPGEVGEWRVEAEFIGAIRGEEELQLTDFETGLRYMAFTEAVNRSLEEGRTVEIEQA